MVQGNKGVVEMRNGDDMPRVTGQGAREKTVRLIDEMGDDDFDNFEGKPGGRG